MQFQYNKKSRSGKTDTVWPWWFVGERRFESFCSEAAEKKDLEDSFQFDVRWRPYQLNEILPKGRVLDKM